MAWTSMHFATGMLCAGGVGFTACFFLRRGWRWLPAAMTAGGFWALVPDMPRIFREDFPSFPFAPLLGDKHLERSLHSFGDLFFFHSTLDAQPRELALHGVFLIILLYNLGLLLLMRMEHRQRNSIANRAWRAHRSSETRPLHRSRRRHRSRHSDRSHDHGPPRYPLPEIGERSPHRHDSWPAPPAPIYDNAGNGPKFPADTSGGSSGGDPIVGHIGFHDPARGSAG